MNLSKRPLPLLAGAAAIAAAGAIAVGGQFAGTTTAATSSAGRSIASLTNPSAAGSASALDPGSASGSGTTTLPGSAGGDTSGAAAATSGATATTGATTEATATQLTGVVDIVTTVHYDQGEAAGTGMVLTASGEVLTNNHVVDGATSISVTVLSTGRTYTAAVVGTSPTNDVAVLQLSGASGLTTARFGDSSSLQVGDAVTGVGNAGNSAGTAASPGGVTALGQDITASDGTGSSSEQLTGLIETSSAIAAGDSGGPLYDAGGKVIGVDTAAQTSGRTGATVAGYAIPINDALSVAAQITSGVDNATVHQGLPAFLGIQTSSAAAFGQSGNGFGASAGGTSDVLGVPVAAVVTGSAADRAGITAGSTVTAVGGVAVSDQSEVTTALASHAPGDRVSISWTDASGAAHRATVTLGSGPAD